VGIAKDRIQRYRPINKKEDGERPPQRDPRSRLSLIRKQKRMDLPQEKENRTFSTSKAGREVK
jgi:hypothetical protein